MRRDQEGPLFRLKAPVRAVLFPFSLGGTFTVQNGASLRIGEPATPATPLSGTPYSRKHGCTQL